MTPFIYLLALVWGAVWALFLQFTNWGKFLAIKRTWFTVAVGVGVDLALLYALLPLEAWIAVLFVVALSAVGIVGRSLWNEFREHREVLRAVQDQDPE